MENILNVIKYNDKIAITEKNPQNNKIKHGEGIVKKITKDYIYLNYNHVLINATRRYKKDNIIKIEFLNNEISEKEKFNRLTKWIDLKYKLLKSTNWIRIKKYHDYKRNDICPYLENRSKAFLNGDININELTECINVYFKKEIYIISAEIKAGIYSE